MAATTTIDRPTAATHLLPTARVGGIGGLVFAGTVLLQNVLRASLPANDAGARAVIDYYASHHGTTVALGALYPVGGLGLAAFVGAVVSRARARSTRGPAVAGAVGAAGVFTLFSVVLATDVALSTYVHKGAPSPDVVSGLWTLHGSVFGVLLLAIAVAVTGLSAAAAGQGLIAPVWKVVGLVSGLALAVTSAAVPALLEGSPVMALGLVGFLLWVLFIAVTSVALLRSPTVAEG